MNISGSRHDNLLYVTVSVLKKYSPYIVEVVIHVRTIHERYMIDERTIYDKCTIDKRTIYEL